MPCFDYTCVFLTNMLQCSAQGVVKGDARMANFTKQHIKLTFAKLLNEMPLHEISVKMIVENCGINRKSFYYHYRDIPALLEELVTEDTESIIRACQGLPSLEARLGVIANHILQNRRIMLHIYRSLSRDSFEKGLLRLCETVAQLYVSSVVGTKKIRQEDLSVVVCLYRCELFGLFLQWLMDGLRQDIDPLIHRACCLCEQTCAELLSRCILEE